MFDEDTMLEVKVIKRDSEGDPVTSTLPVTMTLGQLRDWIITELDGVTEPTWA